MDSDVEVVDEVRLDSPNPVEYLKQELLSESEDFYDDDDEDDEDHGLSSPKLLRSTGSCTMHPCPIPDCDKYFSRPSRLKTHMLSHTGEKPFPCPKCDKAYSRPAHLKRHLANTHDQDSAPARKKSGRDCVHCGKKYASKYSLSKHLKDVHGLPSVAVSQDVQGEADAAAPGGNYKCLECGVVFSKRFSLASHMFSRHQGKLPYRCPECPDDVRFRYPSLLKRHQRQMHHVHSADKSCCHQCKTCPEVFPKWSELRKHLKSGQCSGIAESTEAGRQGFKCEVCGRQLASKDTLRQHRQSHAETRRVYHCQIGNCERFYYYVNNLKDHVEIYHNGKRFWCKLCNAGLSSRRKLANHVQVIHQRKTEPKVVDGAAAQVPKQSRRKRKDKGKPKKSMAAHLAGLKKAELDPDSEKALLSERQGFALDEKQIFQEVRSLGLEWSKAHQEGSDTAADEERVPVVSVEAHVPSGSPSKVRKEPSADEKLEETVSSKSLSPIVELGAGHAGPEAPKANAAAPSESLAPCSPLQHDACPETTESVPRSTETVTVPGKDSCRERGAEEDVDSTS